MNDPPHSAHAFDGASEPQLLDWLNDPRDAVRADAACALGDRLRTRELATLDAKVHARLRVLLDDAAWHVRLEAAIALAEMHDVAATPVLLDATKRRTHRLDAIRALGSGGDVRAIAGLTALLHRWLFPWADRLQAAAALCALGDPAGAAYLVGKLSSRRSAERAAAIHFLGESQHPDAPAQLGNILLRRDHPMRDSAARALGLLRDGRGRQVLLQAQAQGVDDKELAHDIAEALRQSLAGPVD